MPGDRATVVPPNRLSLRQDIAHRCPHVAPQVLDEFLACLDPDYFTLFTLPQMAAHVTLLAAVDDQHPVQVRVIPRSATSADILLAAYDLFGEVSIITGLMAVYGLNIREGHVFSYQRKPTMEAGRIVDLFTVAYPAQRPFDSEAQADFTTQLTALVQLLRQGKLPQARAHLNYRLIDAMRATPQVFSTHLAPVEVRIDNEASADWTVVDIHADDTPAFLYSLSNALAMRNVYIHRVRIQSVAGKVQDQLFLSWRRGGKITSAEGQRELRLIVALIKQFSHFLTIAPDPALALQHFDLFVDRLTTTMLSEEDLQWLWEDSTLKALATVLGSSEFLWDDFLRMQYASLLPVLKDIEATAQRLPREELAARLAQAVQAAATPAARKQALNTVKDRELFRIDMRHLLHPDLAFGLFSEELTDLADVILAGALTLAQATLQARCGQPLLADGSPCAFAVFGLGKLGGYELGYASDIEMLCVYSGPGTTSGPQRLSVSEYAELLVQQLLDLIVARRAGTFELDLRLRPFGSKGPLAASREAYTKYYHPEGPAFPYERQALIKLRWIAGDAVLGRQIEAYRDAFVYSPAPFDLEEAVHLRQRQIDELVSPGTVDTKYSRGGLVDIEYTVQYLQVLHGALLPSVHTTNTLHAMRALQQAELLTDPEYQALEAAYKFLRRLIDALRIVRGNARDLVLPPTEAQEFTFLARRMGYWQDQSAPTQLAQDIMRHMQQAGRVYEKRFKSVVSKT